MLRCLYIALKYDWWNFTASISLFAYTGILLTMLFSLKSYISQNTNFIIFCSFHCKHEFLLILGRSENRDTYLNRCLINNGRNVPVPIDFPNTAWLPDRSNNKKLNKINNLPIFKFWNWISFIIFHKYLNISC